MAFFLFILVNAALFVRPGEIIPSMLGWEIYFYLIVACLIAAVPDVVKQFTEKALDLQPITVCVFGLLFAIFLSDAVGSSLSEATRKSYFFAKILVYFVLFVSVVTTTDRLRTLLLSILVFCGTITTIAVLRYHDVIQLETINALTDNVQGRYGDTEHIQRLQGTGIFQDPNELCVMLASMVPFCLYFLTTDKNIYYRTLSAGVLPLFGYAIFLTHSRGGFLAFVGGLAGLFWSRYGWKKTAVIGALGLPVLLLLFAGRQTDLSTSAGTAQTRIELWRDWLNTFRENMVTGNGMSLGSVGETEKLPPGVYIKHLAHNSYLQGFADLGLFGGCLFIGAFLTALWSVHCLNALYCVQMNSDARQIQPFVFACVTAYCVGMLSLSMCFIVPTFFMLALASAYGNIARRSCLLAPPPLRLDARLLGSFAATGICFLVSIYIFVRSVG